LVSDDGRNQPGQRNWSRQRSVGCPGGVDSGDRVLLFILCCPANAAVTNPAHETDGQPVSRPAPTTAGRVEMKFFLYLEGLGYLLLGSDYFLAAVCRAIVDFGKGNWNAGATFSPNHWLRSLA
jgi:hypothetical protein